MWFVSSNGFESMRWEERQELKMSGRRTKRKRQISERLKIDKHWGKGKIKSDFLWKMNMKETQTQGIFVFIKYIVLQAIHVEYWSFSARNYFPTFGYCNFITVLFVNSAFVPTAFFKIQPDRVNDGGQHFQPTCCSNISLAIQRQLIKFVSKRCHLLATAHKINCPTMAVAPNANLQCLTNKHCYRRLLMGVVTSVSTSGMMLRIILFVASVNTLPSMSFSN